MALDEDAAAVVAAMRQRRQGRRMSEIPIEVLRAGARAARARGPGIASVQDRDIALHDRTVPIRVYRPAVDGGARPVLVYLHGGGWALCDLDTHDALCRLLALQADCVVVAVDYRLAPEHRFPAGFDDAYAAAAWVVEHAAELGGDADRVAIAGDSAGGNLAAAVVLAARDRSGPRFAFQMLFYPAVSYDFDTPSMREFTAPDGFERGGAASGEEEIRWLWREYVGGEADLTDLRLVPGRATDLSRLPATWILTAECDALRDEGEDYAKRLREAGVEVELTRCPGVHHPFLQAIGVVARADEAVADAAAALARALGAETSVPASR